MVSSAPLHPPLGVTSALALYQHGLSAAAHVADHCVVASTLAKRHAVGREFEAWLARLPPPFPRSLLGARPEDLLCFLQQHWVPYHGKSLVPGLEHPVASPQGVAGAISHLSSVFESLGRHGPYDASTCCGNPCDCPNVRAYKAGYQQVMWQAGYQETPAVPITQDKVLALVAYLHKGARAAPTALEAISLLRDALLVEHAWLTAYRGKEGGMLCLPDLHSATHAPLFPSGYDPTVPLPEHLVTLPTHGTKTNRRGRSYQDPVYFHQETSDPAHCFLSHLWVFLQLCHLTGHTITHYIMRPLLPSKKGFKEAPYSSSSFAKLIQSHLTTLGMYSGETSHSFRRGTLQATAAKSGRQAAALHGNIKSPKVLSLYLHPARHMTKQLPPA